MKPFEETGINQTDGNFDVNLKEFLILNISPAEGRKRLFYTLHAKGKPLNPPGRMRLAPLNYL